MELCLAIELTQDNKKQIEKESASIFADHKEYLWFDPVEYRIPIFTWSKVEEELMPKLVDKIRETLFECGDLELFSIDYVVKISSRIDIYLKFQREAKYTRLIRSISDVFFGSGIASPEDFAMVALARYKIPSRQQYTHLKNDLAKIKTDIRLEVKSLSIVKVTEFGKGAKEGKVLMTLPLLENQK